MFEDEFWYHFISAISVRTMNEKLKPEREKVFKYTLRQRAREEPNKDGELFWSSIYNKNQSCH